MDNLARSLRLLFLLILSFFPNPYIIISFISPCNLHFYLDSPISPLQTFFPFFFYLNRYVFIVINRILPALIHNENGSMLYKKIFLKTYTIKLVPVQVWLHQAYGKPPMILKSLIPKAPSDKNISADFPVIQWETDRAKNELLKIEIII